MMTCNCGVAPGERAVRGDHHDSKTCPLFERDGDEKWDNTADRMKQLTDIDVREFEFQDSGGEIEVGLFCEGEWVEGFPLPLDRAIELHRDLGALIARMQQQRAFDHATADEVVTCADGSTEVVDQDELEAAAVIHDELLRSTGIR